MDAHYFTVLLNSTIRSTTPVLLAALGSAICNKVGVFNIALEGQMLIGAFAAIALNFYTANVFLSILAGVIAGALVGLLVAIVQVKYKSADMVVGTSVNLLVGGLTSILLYVIMGKRGSYSSPDLVGLKKINIPFIKDIPYLGRILENLSIIDYLAYVIAIVIFIYLYKTVGGFKMLSIGENKEAAESLGVKSTHKQMLMVVISGALCGLGGVALAMGQVTLFTEGMTAGRGFIGMAAGSMARNHPLGTIASSLFFGLAQALGISLQNTIPSQLTITIPYIATIIALAIFSKKDRQKING